MLERTKKRQEEGVSVIREHGEDAWDVLFRVQSLITKNPVTLRSTFSIATMSEPMEAWEFFWERCRKFAVFDVKALVVPECSTWKLNTCGLLEAFLRALGPKGGSDQGENKSDHFPFTENAEFPDITSVYHALKMRARLHI